MYIMWHPPDFIISPAAFFIVYPVTWVVYGGTVTDLSLVIWVSHSSELLPTFDKEVAEHECACTSVKYCTFMKLRLISGDTCHNFPNSQNTLHCHNSKYCNLKCHVKVCHNFVPSSLWAYIGEISFILVCNSEMDIMRWSCATKTTSQETKLRCYGSYLCMEQISYHYECVILLKIHFIGLQN